VLAVCPLIAPAPRGPLLRGVLLGFGKFSCRFPEEPLEHGLSSAMLEGVMHHGEQHLP
jgi:hypothetical protein